MPASKLSACMQSQISTQQCIERLSTNEMLALVESKMLESFKNHSTQVSNYDTSAFAAATYHLRSGGQRVRAKLALHSAIALGLSVSDAISVASTVELLHNASLIHDDIQDGDVMRRGQKAIWVNFGINTAICTGDLMLSAAYAAIAKLDNPYTVASLISFIHMRTAKAIDGQCADLSVNERASLDTPSALRHYEQIAIAKSGALLCLPIELALVASDQHRFLNDAKLAVDAFAIGYQIIDDLDDRHSDRAASQAGSRFNIVSLYENSYDTTQAVEKATNLGLQHLEVAAEVAARLPRRSGALLIEYAHRLSDRLVAQS